MIRAAVRESVTNSEPSRYIGAILIDSGRLTPENAERVLRLQKAEPGLRFGDAAVKLGLLTQADILHALSSQFDYPYLRSDDAGVSKTIVAAFDPFSPAVDQLRALRSQLLLRWFDADAGRKALAVVSAESGEGRSFVAANLAVVFSQLGEKTLLIDADFRNPCQHILFRAPNKLGLSNVLAGRAGWQEAAQRITGLKGLSVMPSGAVPPNPQELLARSAFSSLLASLKDQYDIIIIDTPAGSETSEAAAIAARAGGALVIAKKDATSVENLKALVEGLTQSGATAVGTLLNTF